MANQETKNTGLIDNNYYLDADRFFSQTASHALTYDDVSLATTYSEVLPRNTQTQASLSNRVQLHIPIISADMDTVTESKMAIAMALHGGLGLIHYNMSYDRQLREVVRVKNHIHGLIQDPITVSPRQTIAEVLKMVEANDYDFRTFPVVDDNKKLLGLIKGGVVRERYQNKTVFEAMTPRDAVFTIQESALGTNPIQTADDFFTKHMGIHKLLVVNKEDRLCGLFTLSDIERISEEVERGLKPARDHHFRLLCGAAVAAQRTTKGEVDMDRTLAHIHALVDAGLDAIAVSTAHGHSSGVGALVKIIRAHFKDITLIAGNVTSGAGVAYLAECGADAVKIGQGPGSICTTRVVAGVGIPQLTALYVASQAAKKKGVKILADGGITKSGDIVKALTLADAVICGNLLAGCPEAPGKIMEINGKLYKQYRGMGSLEAMQAGSASRYGHSKKKHSLLKAAAEGVQALKELSDSLDKVLIELVGGLQSGMGYLGANTLSELKQNARYVQVSPAGQKESGSHNVIEVKSSRL